MVIFKKLQELNFRLIQIPKSLCSFMYQKFKNVIKFAILASIQSIDVMTMIFFTCKQKIFINYFKSPITMRFEVHLII